LCSAQDTKAQPVQYRERSDRMPHSISAVILTIALLSVVSGRFARGTVLLVHGSAKFYFFGRVYDALLSSTNTVSHPALSRHS